MRRVFSCRRKVQDAGLSAKNAGYTAVGGESRVYTWSGECRVYSFRQRAQEIELPTESAGYRAVSGECRV